MKNEQAEILAKYYEKYHKDFLRVACSALRDPHEAEVVLQDTFTTAAQCFDAFITSENPVGWLYRTMGNMMKRIIFERKVAQNVLVSYDETYEPPGEEDAVSVFLEYRGIIPDEQLSMLIDFHCHQRPAEWLARKYGMSVGNVRVTLYRARERFRKKTLADVGSLKNI